MNERIRKLRDFLGLTQENFGKRIGSARNTIANYENGSRKPSNAVILSICREFNVNEEWLRLGQGNMLKGVETDDGDPFLIAECVGILAATLVNKDLELQEDDFDFKDILVAYKKMSPHGKKCFVNFFEGLLCEVKKVSE